MALIQRNQIYLYMSNILKISFTVIEFFFLLLLLTHRNRIYDPHFDMCIPHLCWFSDGPAKCTISLLTFLHWFCFYLHIHVRFLTAYIFFLIHSFSIFNYLIDNNKQANHQVKRRQTMVIEAPLQFTELSLPPIWWPKKHTAFPCSTAPKKNKKRRKKYNQ